MRDQPKPATGASWYRRLSEQLAAERDTRSQDITKGKSRECQQLRQQLAASKPATGEWTNKMVTDFIGHNVNSRDLVRLVSAINAALAAANKKWSDRHERKIIEHDLRHKQQLAAERENRIREDREWERSKQLDLAEIQQLRQQLADEREKRDDCVRRLEDITNQAIKLKHQLAATVEALQKARHRFEKSGWPEAATEIDAALAKIGARK